MNIKIPNTNQMHAADDDDAWPSPQNIFHQKTYMCGVTQKDGA